MKSTTIIDVAKKAQVSVATVSRVVNGNYPVKEATKKKVLEAIKDLEYIPILLRVTYCIGENPVSSLKICDK